MSVAFWYIQKSFTQEMKSDAIIKNTISQNIVNTPKNEIDTIQDLIDGEYTFEPIDTTNWKTYRNEKMGFEMKVPKNWYVRDLSQSNDERESHYYDGSERFAVCFGEQGKKYNFENGEKDGMCLYYDKNKDEYLHDSSFRDVLINRKTIYDSKIYSLTIDNKIPVIVQKGFGIESYIFRGNELWILSYSLAGYTPIEKNYPIILKSIKFL